MVLDAESVIDRRRLKRRLTAWRIAAVALGLLLLGALLLNDPNMVGSAGHLAPRRAPDRDGRHHRRPQDARADRQGRQVGPGQGRHRRHQQSGRHHDRRRGDVRRHQAARREEAGGGRVRDACHLRRLYHRARHRPHLRLRQHHHRLGRRDLPMGRGDRPLAHARHQGRGGEERPAESRAQSRSSRSTRRAGR